jgi:hypothetical protein
MHLHRAFLDLRLDDVVLELLVDEDQIVQTIVVVGKS